MTTEAENSSEPKVTSDTNGSESPPNGSNNGELNSLPEEKRWPGWPGESVFRVLVPVQKVGSIIGRKGEIVKKMCEESKARIKVLDGPPNAPERIVMVSAREEPESSLPPAIDGLLRVHKRVIEGLEGQPAVSNIVTRLLVAAAQGGSLIGRQGATIKSIQDTSNCMIRVLEDSPGFALHEDRVVEIHGEPGGVHKAVELIGGQLRKFLVDRSVLPLFEMQAPPSGLPNEQSGPAVPPWGPPTGAGADSAGFGSSNPPYMGARPHERFYPPSEVPPVDKPPYHNSMAGYGREAPPLGGLPQSSLITQITQRMQIPLSFADAVIGSAGANISYIRRSSGATITIQETRGVPSEMTVEIIGTATQVQTAQQLIQNFMAEAAGPKVGPPGEAAGYGSYQAHGPPGYGGGNYGSGYGNNYGY